MLNTIIDSLNHELSRPAIYDKADRTVHLDAVLAHEVLAALRWAGDEIAQLREDLSGSMGAVVQMTAELSDLEAEVGYLREAVEDHEFAERLADQRLDYSLGV